MLSRSLQPLRRRIIPILHPTRSQRLYQTTQSTGTTNTGSSPASVAGALMGGAVILSFGAYVWNNISQGKAVANLEMNDNGGDDTHNKTPTGKKMS